MTAAESIDLPRRPMTYKEAGAILGRGERFIRERVRDGRLRASIAGYNCKRILPLDLLQFLELTRNTENRKRKRG